MKTKTQTKTQIIVRGVRVWPIQWGYVVAKALTLSAHWLLSIAGIFACVILAPGVPDIARNKEMMHDINLLLVYIPMDVRTDLPVAIAIIFTSYQIIEGAGLLDQILPDPTDRALKPLKPLLLILIGAFVFLATVLNLMVIFAR